MRNKVKFASGGKIKIAIDISPTVDGNSIRGVGYYTQNLVKALQQQIKTNPDYKNWTIDLVKNTHDLRSKSYNLIHYPYFDPFKLTLPQTKNIPTVVTVHDLIPRQFKSRFPVGIRGELKWFFQKQRLKKVSHLITVSEYSKTVIQKIVKVPADKITPIYEAAASNFKPIKDIKKIKEIKNKYSLPEKFILFIGDINWNKNIPNLVKACLKNKYPLVIVGSAATKKDVPDHPWTQDLLWLQSKYQKLKRPKNKRLIFTGFVPDEDLPLIYNLATIYCQPSYAEGFGLPLVEAMQSGCPVTFSRDTCLPEIMDNCGLSFNPRSLPDITDSLKKLWNNPSLRQKYSHLGLNRAKNFNWKKTAKETLIVYQSLFGHEK